jgi:hypothetical protein
VCILLSEIVGPGIDVRIEVDQPQRPIVTSSPSAQQWKRDAVLAAERDQVPDRSGLLLDQFQASGDIAKRDREISNVGNRKLRRVHPPVRVIAVHEHGARLADRSRPEPRARPIGGPDVKGYSGNAKRGSAVVARDPEEAR